MARRRPRHAGAGDLLLSLRVLPRGAAQRVRQYPLSEHAGTGGILSRIRESAAAEPAGDSAHHVDGTGGAGGTAGGGGALAETVVAGGGRDGGGVGRGR